MWENDKIWPQLFKEQITLSSRYDAIQSKKRCIGWSTFYSLFEQLGPEVLADKEDLLQQILVEKMDIFQQSNTVPSPLLYIYKGIEQISY